MALIARRSSIARQPSATWARVDLSVPDQVDQFRQVAAHWGRAAVQMHMREEIWAYQYSGTEDITAPQAQVTSASCSILTFLPQFGHCTRQ